MSVPSCLSRRKGHVCNLTRYVAKRLAPCDSTYELQSRVPYLTAHQALGHPWPLMKLCRVRLEYGKYGLVGFFAFEACMHTR